MENSASDELSFEKQTFLQDLQPLTFEVKSFYDQFLATERDVFRDALYRVSVQMFLSELSM